MMDSEAAPRKSAFFPWALGFALLCWPLIFLSHPSNYEGDEKAFYLPAIEAMRAHWPRLDLQADSLSATAPGYAYVLATASYVVGHSVFALRLVNWGLSLAVLFLLWSVLNRTRVRALTLALAPLALSNFFVKSASWVVTDNAALLLVAACLIQLLFSPSAVAGTRAAVLVAAGVLVRQISLWLAAPLAIRTWHDVRASRQWLRGLAMLIPLPPLFWLLAAWGGLVPPRWAMVYPDHEFSGAAGLYLLAVVATLAPAYYFAVVDRPRFLQDLRSFWPLVGTGFGLAFALTCPSLPNHDAGRWGGYWWTLAGRMPAIGGHSIVFLVLAPLGGVFAGLMLARLWREVDRLPRYIWLAAAAGWAATLFVNRLTFHRYFEPPLLVLLICWIALLAKARPGFRLQRLWPLAVLSTIQLLLTLTTAHARALNLF